MKVLRLFLLFSMAYGFNCADLKAQVAYIDSAEIETQVRAFISDSSSYTYADPDDSNKIKSAKVDRIGRYNRQQTLVHINALSDTIVALTKKEVVYKVNVYIIAVDEYGRYNFEEVVGGSGTAQFYDHDNCIKRPMVLYNWRIDPLMPGYLYIDVVCGSDNCYF